MHINLQYSVERNTQSSLEIMLHEARGHAHSLYSLANHRNVCKCEFSLFKLHLGGILQLVYNLKNVYLCLGDVNNIFFTVFIFILDTTF